MDFNKVIVVGRLTRDVECRYTQAGTAVATLNIAQTLQRGTDYEKKCFVRATVWAKRAETCAEYLIKGQEVCVEGELNPDPETGGPRLWFSEGDGQARASYEITARNVVFGNKPRSAQGQGNNGNGNSANAPKNAPVEEEEIPF